MNCPICGENLVFEAGDAVLLNVETYQRAATAKTKCCNSLLRIYPKIDYEMVNVTGLDGAEDEWGY